MQCTSCRAENEEGAKFCSACGAPFVRLCPSCGQQMQPTAKFCSECGTLLQVKEKLVPAKRRKDAHTARQATRPRTRATSATKSRPTPPEAERRQLTVMFCDLVGSTALSAQLDPEEYRQVVQQYQDTCTEVIRHYEGQIAQHLGDGLLVYFGYPTAHEDDAARAVRAGLEIIHALKGQETESGEQRKREPLQVRIGIHTGLVVIGEIGSSAKREMLALGETPNLAARIQGIAEPDTVVVSAVTQRLVQGLFDCQDLGPQTLKGIAAPVLVYRIMGESGAQSRFEVAVTTGLTPLVGREEELGLLQRRWIQAKEGAGQVVLLSGEPGIGKSRLAQTLKEQVLAEGATRIEFRCSPYHQNSAFYPIIGHLHRLLQFQRDDLLQAKLTKLRQILSVYHFPQTDTLSLLATLLSLPQPEGIPPLTLSPQKQKQKTQEVLVAWIMEETQKAAVYCAWEDLHWADPSTLEVLTLLLEHIPTARVFSVLTFRPEFTPLWSARSYVTQLTLNRLSRSYVETMVANVTGGKSLPVDVLQQIVTKTDGVPLFVEELTKSVVEAVGMYSSAPRQVGIPVTLQDALMARLDRLGRAKEIVQLGATLGREFTYEVLHAVSPLPKDALQEGLKQLVKSELVYQSGLPPQVTYVFKHALIQDTAYQSLLKSKRQQLHHQIARTLADRFPDTIQTQPELLAHHYTEAGLKEQAIPYWQQAGEHATQRSAYMEAINHLTRGLELLKTLPDTPERVQHELTLQIALSTPLIATRSWAAPEVEHIHARALAICQQIGETPQLFSVLAGLSAFYNVRGEQRIARELGEQLLRLAENTHDSALLMRAHTTLAIALYYLGEVPAACAHFEQGLTWHDPQQPSLSSISCLSQLANVLWELGYPDQALIRIHEALSEARQLSLPFWVGYASHFTAVLHFHRRMEQAAQEQAEAVITLSTEHGFPFWLGWATLLRGWALAMQGQGEGSIRQIHEGLDTLRAMGAGVGQTTALTMLAEAYGKAGQAEEGLALLAGTLAVVDKTGERRHEAELYRLKGELLQQQSSVQSLESNIREEAKECFLKAIEIARKQQAKSWELRASTSLARLWQQQGKGAEAHKLLSEVYNWFTEGFDTKDLQEARALLDTLAGESADTRVAE